MAKHCKKPVKIIEFSEIGKFLESLFGNSFISLNKIYKKDGEAYKIKLRKKHIMMEKDIKSLVESLYKKKTEIVYE